MSESVPCGCSHSGWCSRHNVDKPPHWHHLCLTNCEYRKAWDEGTGPGQKRFLGLGDVISILLGMVGIRPTATCNCIKYKAWLNERFPLWPIKLRSIKAQKP